MDQFVSDPITPLKEGFDAAAMGRGEPGLPAGFVWRDAEYRIARELERWKQSSPEGGRAGNEVYLRRHCYRLLMDSGDVWSIYFTRQPVAGSGGRQRWFLYTVARAGGAADR